MATTPSRMKFAGWTGVAVGGLLAVAVTGYPERLNTPHWVAYLAASAFVLGGGASLARGYERASLAQGCVALLLSAFLVIGLWLAFGPRAQQCVGGIAGLGFAASDTSCRLAFGLGAGVVALMLFLAVRGWLLGRRAE